MSKQRDKFMAAKKAKREQRADDKWHREHTSWCQGTRNGKPCLFEVRFRAEAEGVTAVCRRCDTVHVYGRPMTSTGPASPRWMTQAVYSESVPEPEAVEVVELVSDEGSTKEVRLMDHASWCTNRGKDLYGARGEWNGAGKIVWRMGGRFWHTCLSSQAGRDLAYARWGNAR